MTLAEVIYQHSLSLPESAAREVLDFIEFLEQRHDPLTIAPDTGEQWKTLLAAMPDVGSDEDFSRPQDYGDESSDLLKSIGQAKFSRFPSRLKITRDEVNDRRPEYMTMEVDEIVMPSRDERYER